MIELNFKKGQSKPFFLIRTHFQPDEFNILRQLRSSSHLSVLMYVCPPTIDFFFTLYRKTISSQKFVHPKIGVTEAIDTKVGRKQIQWGKKFTQQRKKQLDFEID